MNLNSEKHALTSVDLNIELFNATDNSDKIVFANDLHKYSSIDELLGEDYYKIIFIGDPQQMGHYTVLLAKKPGHVDFFCSFGRMYPEVEDFCTRLGLKCSYNTYKLQNSKSYLCGNYCILKINSYPLKNKHLIDILTCNNKKTPDEIVYSLYKIKRFNRRENVHEVV